MNDVLYAGGASPATGTGGGDIDVSGLLKTDASNLAPAGREAIAGIAVASVSLDNLADKDLAICRRSATRNFRTRGFILRRRTFWQTVRSAPTKFRLLLWIFCRTRVCMRL